MTLDKSYKMYSYHLNSRKEAVRKTWAFVRDRLSENIGMTVPFKAKIDELIKNHDDSKWGGEEFLADRERMYPVEENKNKLLKAWEEQMAWATHISKNPHHWEYWASSKESDTSPTEMPYAFIIQMLCDWVAMCLDLNIKPSEWFENNKRCMSINYHTKNTVCDLMYLFDEAYLELKNEN